jgi:hypothetical protein
MSPALVVVVVVVALLIAALPALPRMRQASLLPAP